MHWRPLDGLEQRKDTASMAAMCRVDYRSNQGASQEASAVAQARRDDGLDGEAVREVGGRGWIQMYFEDRLDWPC